MIIPDPTTRRTAPSQARELQKGVPPPNQTNTAPNTSSPIVALIMIILARLASILSPILSCS